jgi:hypothetical protein
VAGGVSSGISAVALETNLPIVFGVITTDTIEQAIERAGTKAGNKGFEAAVTAIEMVSLMERVDERPDRNDASENVRIDAAANAARMGRPGAGRS